MIYIAYFQVCGGKGKYLCATNVSIFCRNDKNFMIFELTTSLSGHFFVGDFLVVLSR